MKLNKKKVLGVSLVLSPSVVLLGLLIAFSSDPWYSFQLISAGVVGLTICLIPVFIGVCLLEDK